MRHLVNSASSHAMPNANISVPNSMPASGAICGAMVSTLSFLCPWFLYLMLSFSGHVNCPSGYDESEEECGTARKLLELPGGIFAALGCIAAAVAACFIFCIFGLVRKRKKGVDAKPTLNGTLRKDFKKSDLFMDPGS